VVLTSLELVNFRNHPHTRFDLERRCAFFYGNNGAGKSNILEAIYFLAYTKSYRSSDASKLIRHDAGSAEIHASFIDDQKIEHEISAVIGKKKGSVSTGKRSRGHRRFSVCSRRLSSFSTTALLSSAGLKSAGAS